MSMFVLLFFHHSRPADVAQMRLGFPKRVFPAWSCCTQVRLSIVCNGPAQILEVCPRMRACVRARVRVCVRVCVRARRACVRACVRARRSAFIADTFRFPDRSRTGVESGLVQNAADHHRDQEDCVLLARNGVPVAKGVTVVAPECNGKRYLPARVITESPDRILKTHPLSAVPFS
jgi:hypothetical protein